ncbi:PucR family transcriptional regulator [Mycobacterium deserti]|uniref:Helix-turn-helix domain-containing protein n=1 Tax=Mycobacterium deserti TaxID=2978347 RepID=A0ABT2MEJ6_9MYCO|nr:helix-turn-helix domain-containing protein [Mycobacterium deserti]MCT7660667.1 helix-turn-helix domain-containing protein [Mycobacterium deserti]
MRRLVAALQHLSSLAVQDAGLESVAEFVAERIDTAVAVVDDQLTLLAASGGSESDAARYFSDPARRTRLAQVLAVAAPTRRALRIPGVAGVEPIIVAPVPVGDTVPAFLLTLDVGDFGSGEDLRLLLSEHAATICGVILGRARVLAAAATQARGDLIEGLLAGAGSDADEVRRWAAHLGYDEHRKHRVVSVVVVDASDGEDAARLPAAVARFFNTQAPDAITALRGREVVVVLPEQDDATQRALRLAERCIGRMSETFGAAPINAGVGGMCSSSTEIARSYDDARRTVDIVCRTGHVGTSLAVEQLGIHRLLLQVASRTQLRAFARQVFGDLLVHGNGTTTEYLSTLARYFRANNSPQAVARELHMHRNTVIYRIRRIEEMSSLDLRNYRDRLMAQVALEILDMVDLEEAIS